ncbi:T9SS type A sorting domain-containing protein [Chitinispirillales bacterium ANBcel5]|uniref:T9SS type A sorting domain-containing protein n=1 Tax=Cellulosispirillum alkaliphilum TaxID=3039283 RepID=UPI002A50CC32|nr:T9SS type A sorting domain-containing protein [Chitinispirillales bacterium ANBcel5]
MFIRDLYRRVIKIMVMLCVFLMIPQTATAQTTAEITRSGSTWSTDIGSNTEYSGSSLAAAINAASSAMRDGTINIRNSGSLDDRISPRANQTFDFHENEISASGSAGFRANRVNGITIRNLRMTGSPTSPMSFHGCSHLHFHNVSMIFDGRGGGVRVDNDRGNPVRTTNLRVTGGIRIEGTRGHGFETYTVDTIFIDRFISRNTNYCGLILNDSRNAEIGYIYAYRADHGGGYAGFRTANRNGPNIVVDTLITVDCGRGFFSVSRSHGTTINYVNITGSTGHGMLIQNAEDVHIRGGVIWNNNCGEAIRFSTDPGSAGGYMDCRNNIIENVRIFDDRGPNRQQVYGIRETSDGGRTGYNIVRNCDLRDAGSNRSRDLVLDGVNSQSIGNALTGDPPLLPDDGGIVEPDDPIDRGSGDFFENLTLFETTNANNWNIMSDFSSGQTSFGDRDFIVESIPDYLNGSEWIQTAMNSRTNASIDNYAFFTANTNGFLFIAHSDRIEEKPEWLSNYENTEETITIEEDTETHRTLTLYRKAISQGDEIELGINSSDGTTLSLMYIPIITDQTDYCEPTAITPYTSVNDEDWVEGTEVTLLEGESVQLGPHPEQEESWTWSGPDEFSTQSREIELSNISSDQAGEYTAVFTNDCGEESEITFTVVVEPSVSVSKQLYPSKPKVSLKNNSIKLMNPGTSEWTMSIFDLRGKTLLRKTINSGTHTIPLYTLIQNGSYIIRVNNGNELIVNRRINIIQ